MSLGRACETIGGETRGYVECGQSVLQDERHERVMVAAVDDDTKYDGQEQVWPSHPQWLSVG